VDQALFVHLPLGDALEKLNHLEKKQPEKKIIMFYNVPQEY